MIEPYYSEPGITIYHADCRDVLPTLPSVDLVLTDPPYGVGMKAFDDDFGVVRYLDICPGAILGMFMSPRRVADTIHALPSWSFERVLWMEKVADLAYPWRGWLCNSEAILVFSRTGARWPKEPASYRRDVYAVAPWGKVGHPNAKPISVVKDMIGKLHRSEDTILDPFMGSGTTLRAAKDLGRRANVSKSKNATARSQHADYLNQSSTSRLWHRRGKDE